MDLEAGGPPTERVCGALGSCETKPSKNKKLSGLLLLFRTVISSPCVYMAGRIPHSAALNVCWIKLLD